MNNNGKSGSIIEVLRAALLKNSSDFLSASDDEIVKAAFDIISSSPSSKDIIAKKTQYIIKTDRGYLQSGILIKQRKDGDFTENPYEAYVFSQESIDIINTLLEAEAEYNPVKIEFETIYVKKDSEKS